MNATELRQKMFRRLPDLENEGETPVPSQKFWDYYHENKELFKEADILVIKVDANRWYIQDKRANIGELEEKHPPKCENCGERRELVRRAAKNDTKQYFWYCIDCNKMSGAIPHILTKHLIDEGQPVNDLAELKKRILLDQLREKHPPECSEPCGKHRELVQREVKGGSIQYYWYCINCDKMSGAIPYKFAEHLIKNEGQAVRDIE